MVYFNMPEQKGCIFAEEFLERGCFLKPFNKDGISLSLEWGGQDLTPVQISP